MRAFLKRLIDMAIATVTLLVLAPLILGIAIAVWLALGRPILFPQKRAGYRGKPFTLFKFRTMREARDAQGRSLPDGERLSRAGTFLRRFSLDELPQIWNVWKGEMSLVGPRPLLIDYLPRYTAEQTRRHDVKPGITGWAQVNGRNALSWDEKFALDVWYVDHASLWLDGKILARTIWSVLARKAINQPGQATAEEFLGTRLADRGTR
jgi:lipopolysaccharide/colanic/teichoic acid biosynthesis glycosyltransferase